MKKGFSLIELLTVLTIIGIITTITYPGYRHYIIRAHRTDGQTSLLDLANRMERYYGDHHTYQAATISQNKDSDVLSSNISDEGWYTLSIVNATDFDFSLRATPRGSQANHDRLCQTLTFNSSGSKGVTSGPIGAPIGTAEQCW